MLLFATGISGFLGRHFLNHATARGHSIRAACRGSGDSMPSLDGVEWVGWPHSASTGNPFEGCGGLVHLAAHGVSPQPANWADAFEFNVFRSVALIEQALAGGIGKIVACGSCVEYGRSGERYEAIPADAPLEPVGPYAASKAAFSLALASIARTSSAGFHLLRPFNLFGEGQDARNLWPSMREAALTGKDFDLSPGQQVRDFLAVEEAARRVIDCLESPNPPRGGLRIANLGSGNPTTIADFARRWWERWGAAGKLRIGALAYRQGEVMRLVPDLTPRNL